MAKIRGIRQRLRGRKSAGEDQNQTEIKNRVIVVLSDR